MVIVSQSRCINMQTKISQQLLCIFPFFFFLPINQFFIIHTSPCVFPSKNHFTLAGIYLYTLFFVKLQNKGKCTGIYSCFSCPSFSKKNYFSYLFQQIIDTYNSHRTITNTFCMSANECSKQQLICTEHRYKHLHTLID